MTRSIEQEIEMHKERISHARSHPRNPFFVSIIRDSEKKIVALKHQLKEVLQHGDYCEVTREQAVELLNIEGYEQAEHYVGYWFSFSKGPQFIWRHEDNGLIISGIEHGDFKTKLPFTDFRQRLINTVNNGK